MPSCQVSTGLQASPGALRGRYIHVDFGLQEGLAHVIEDSIDTNWRDFARVPPSAVAHI